ncbi:deaminase [Tetragenococcus halophilus subsp. flandriensis]|uniref:amidohydrolase n=1 Tax=Tetragenococcus halophilus TaxID=51669 RepID=UPI0023E91434|nr:amidohydrolase [Tetragenococcus halophilus]GMA08557.1 deaminase [Tetragenococcus halophilus subsp. flandriensis]
MKILKNVRLETGEYFDNRHRLQTKTELFDLRIDDKKITQIIPTKQSSEEAGIDMKGQLCLPAFKDMHNHLDKTYLSLPWKACIPSKNLAHRLKLEAEELTKLAETTEQRASTMIEKYLASGVDHIRTHVNIDPFIGLKNLEGVKKALKKYEKYLTADIIAFPQHGLLAHPEMPDLLRKALNSGASMLGALDPGGIDQDIEHSLQITMDIAKEFQVDVDTHFHDPGQLGYYTMDKWLDMVEEQDFKGKTGFSHAFGLCDLSNKAWENIYPRLQEHAVQILTTIPISMKKKLLPIEALQKADIFVGIGCDGFYDSWSPYVSGDVVEKLRNYCDYTGKSNEQALRQSLSLITNNLTPLDENGQKQWPEVGDTASFVFTDAICSAQVAARIPEKRTLMHEGNFYSSK